MADELEYVKVGTDRWRAHLIAETCRDEGLEVQLLTSDAGGADPALSFLQDHRLLVHAADAHRVREILDRF